MPITQPLIQRLPSMYQDGMFIDEFTAGLDIVLAPIIATLDCLDAYVDPEVAPPTSSGGWGTGSACASTRTGRSSAGGGSSPPPPCCSRRGTAHGLSDEIELYTGGAAEVDDPGRCGPRRCRPARRSAASRGVDRTVRVTVDVTNATDVNWPALQVLIRDAVPAHLPVEIELRETSTPKRRGKRKDGDVERSETS